MRKNEDGSLWMPMTPLGIYMKIYRRYYFGLLSSNLNEDKKRRIATIGAVKNTPKEWREQFNESN